MTELHVQVPEPLVAGAFANTLAVWSSPHEFTLDFGVPDHGADLDQLLVTARVRLPVSVVFEVLRALNHGMDQHEAAFGPIREVGPAPAS